MVGMHVRHDDCIERFRRQVTYQIRVRARTDIGDQLGATRLDEIGTTRSSRTRNRATRTEHRERQCDIALRSAGGA